jgi:NADH-quinone oxidoreductase subunit C
MAKKDEILQKLRAILSEEAVCPDERCRSGIAFSAQVPAAKLRDAAKACESEGFYLESITGLDFRDTAELVYHLNCYEPMSRLALRVLHRPDEAPRTLSDIYPSALWLEREVHEFFGVSFLGHPDPRPLLLPEDADYHPLRKTFGKVYAYRERKEIYG